MKNKKPLIEISEPTEEEIKQTRELAKIKFGISVPKKEVCKIVKIIKELNWWLKLPEGPHRISEEMLSGLNKLIKKRHGKELPKSELYDEAHSLLTMVTYKEKERLADEMRIILVNHRKVDYNPELLAKLKKLFDLYYNIEPTETELKRVLYYISKHIWQEEGLGVDVSKCLDDLLFCADKEKRGKRLNGLNQHEKIRDKITEIIKNG